MCIFLGWCTKKMFYSGEVFLCTHTTLFIVITIHYCILNCIVLTTLNMELGNSRARAVLL